jgi:hypothetical protein
MLEAPVLAGLLVQALRGLKWRVRQGADGETGAPQADLVVTDPNGKVYYVELKDGEDPMHFATIAQIEQSARLLSEREGGRVTPILVTNQAVRQVISQLAGEVGIQVVQSPESESDQEAANSVIQALRTAAGAD